MCVRQCTLPLDILSHDKGGDMHPNPLFACLFSSFSTFGEGCGNSLLIPFASCKYWAYSIGLNSTEFGEVLQNNET